jgi:hypothetical protein
VLRGPQADGVRHPRVSQRSFSDPELAAIDHLASNEGIVIGNRYGTNVARVHVIEVANVGVEDVPVADERIVNVDPLREAAATTEPWIKRFAVT